MFHTPGFCTVFTRKRFEEIRRFIHFSDPYEVIPDRYDQTMIPYTRLVLLLITYRRNLKVYGLHNHWFPLTKPWYLLKSDSESNSLFLTNLSVSVSNHESTTGYCCKFDIYVGKSKEADDPLALGKSAAVVMNLVKGLKHKNYDVYMDNYYTSVSDPCHRNYGVPPPPPPNSRAIFLIMGNFNKIRDSSLLVIRRMAFGKLIGLRKCLNA